MFLTSETLHNLSVKSAEKPDEFTYPFNYVPHKWVEKAAKEVQEYLAKQSDLDYNFGWDSQSIGKMFGVLVVETQPKTYGYLAAFSGKLNQKNFYPGFVPPVYDILNPNDFFKKGEQALNKLNQQITDLESSETLKQLELDLINSKEEHDAHIQYLKGVHKKAKVQRDMIRDEIKQWTDNNLKSKKLVELKNESIQQHYNLKKFKKSSLKKMEEQQRKIKAFQQNIDALKQKRQQMSAQIQEKLHEQYQFYNAKGEIASLRKVFKPYNRVPPAGAGECAAPRLLNYAYQNGWKPIAMGEFWWGASPASEVREHKNYYPACKSRCEPILSYMLQGLPVAPNPILTSPGNANLDIVYEDDYLMVVNKPAGLLTVPGKTIKECLWQQVVDYLPKKEEPMMVHRLDMSTSGLVLIAKNLDSYRNLQHQFMERKVSKSYTAILDGIVAQDMGKIELPLRVDLDNRPMQLVCNTHGKPALTQYRVMERDIENNTTRIAFYPITGRTHQLRVHAAHSLGLHAPIQGDDLYGTTQDRLYLHATTLSFYHPATNKKLKFASKPPF